MTNVLFEIEYKQTIEERIKQLRRLMLVHSHLYYVLDDTVITDDHWQYLADELAILQKEHGTKWKCYDNVFLDWDGSTGMHLPADGWVRTTAHYLINLQERMKL